ncbi:MAG TPA: hypothetical protein VF219_21770 [Vicinamibacterales bacterium]|jgi:uncharacterized membrane protein YidH (DUF202 family)
MKALGAVLVVLGLIGVIYGGINWTHKKTVLDAGPVEITTDKHERLPISPIAGTVMLVAGVVLMVRPGR